MISFREGDNPPRVAFVNRVALTFREFRRHLSIPSRNNLQFFFKSQCDDGSADYVMLLVSDDSAIVPVFEGKVMAEGRSLSESD